MERRNVTIINTSPSSILGHREEKRGAVNSIFKALRMIKGQQQQEVTCFSLRRLTSRLKSSSSNSESLSLLKKELLKELLFRFGSEAL